MKSEEGPLHRQLKGISKLYADIIFALIPMVGIIGIINLPSYLGISLHLQQYIGLIFGLLKAVGASVLSAALMPALVYGLLPRSGPSHIT